MFVDNIVYIILVNVSIISSVLEVGHRDLCPILPKLLLAIRRKQNSFTNVCVIENIIMIVCMVYLLFWCNYWLVRDHINVARQYYQYSVKFVFILFIFLCLQKKGLMFLVCRQN